MARSAARSPSWPRGHGRRKGTDDDGRPIALIDSRADALRARARSDDDLAFVADRELFGDLVDDERFTTAFRTSREVLRAGGSRRLLEWVAGR